MSHNRCCREGGGGSECRGWFAFTQSRSTSLSVPVRAKERRSVGGRQNNAVNATKNKEENFRGWASGMYAASRAAFLLLCCLKNHNWE